MTTSAETAARFAALYHGRRRKTGERRKRRLGADDTLDYLRRQTDRLYFKLRNLQPVTADMFTTLERAVWVSPWTTVLPEPPPNLKPLAKESNADMLRRLRLAAVARGDCYQCRCRPVKPGRRYCQECLDRTGAYLASIRYRKCQTCGKPWRKTLLCPDCTAKNAKRVRAHWDERIASGLCGACGKSPLVAEKTMCLPCLEDTRLRVLAVERHRGRKPRPCPVCRELGIEGYGHDRRTHDRWMMMR